MSKLKDSVIDVSKAIIAQVVLATIEDCADVTFDKKQLSEEDVNFLKTTKLSQIEFVPAKTSAKFLIRNKDSERTIEVSNRLATNNELRGTFIREKITQARQINPEQNLYEILNHILNNPNTSGILATSKGFFVGLQNSTYDNKEVMEDEHFILFTRILYEILMQKKNKSELVGVTYKDVIKSQSDVRDHIWQGIDLSRIYDATREINSQLQQIDNKVNDLDKRGYKIEAGLARQLASDLKQELEFLKEGTINVEIFCSHCVGRIEQVQHTSLASIRGFGKWLNDLLNGLIGFLNSLGCSIQESVKKSDTADKLEKAKTNFTFFKEVIVQSNSKEEFHDSSMNFN